MPDHAAAWCESLSKERALAVFGADHRDTAALIETADRPIRESGARKCNNPNCLVMYGSNRRSAYRAHTGSRIKQKYSEKTRK